MNITKSNDRAQSEKLSPLQVEETLKLPIELKHRINFLDTEIKALKDKAFITSIDRNCITMRENEREKLKKGYCTACCDFGILIRDLPETEKKIIRMFYLDGLAVSEIAKKTFYSKTAVYRKLKKGLYDLQN